jgi:hypothetical protein
VRLEDIEEGKAMTEVEHDELVAKPLMEIMKVVADKGGSLLAYSSFTEEDGGKGFTASLHSPEPSAHERIISLAIQTKGNIDRMVIELIRMHNAGLIDASQSIVLASYMRAQS